MTMTARSHVSLLSWLCSCDWQCSSHSHTEFRIRPYVIRLIIANRGSKKHKCIYSSEPYNIPSSNLLFHGRRSYRRWQKHVFVAQKQTTLYKSSAIFQELARPRLFSSAKCLPCQRLPEAGLMPHTRSAMSATNSHDRTISAYVKWV